jgi:hypothetical protein
VALGGAAGPAAPRRSASDAQWVLDAQAAAVRADDRARFTATLAPGTYRDRQEQVFTNLTRLPLAGLRYRVTAVEAASDTSMTVAATLTYRLRGFDAAPVSRARYATLTRTGASWRVAGDGTAYGHPDAPDIWAAGPLTVVRDHGALVLGTGVPPARLRDLARRAAAAIRRVDAVWTPRWARRAVLLVPQDERHAAALAGARGTTEIGSLAALATVASGPDGTPPPGSGDRVVLAPDGFARLSGLGRDVVLTHELTHVATRAATTASTPLWLVEGFADYAGYRGRGVPVRTAAQELAAGVRRSGPPSALPGDAAFAGTARALPQAYEQAWLACRLIAARYGETRLTRLYTAAGRGTTDHALRGVLGADTSAFTAAWRSYLRRELN